MGTGIEYCDETANPFGAESPERLGWWCRKISSGCAHCYAERINLSMGNGRGFSMKAVAQGPPLRPRLLLDRLEKYKTSKVGKIIFVNDMTDTFLSLEICRRCGHVMEDESRFGEPCAGCQANTVIRYWRREWVQDLFDNVTHLAQSGHVILLLTKRAERAARETLEYQRRTGQMLHKNIWIGFSAENQAAFNHRSFFAKRMKRRMEGPVWISYEPALGPISLPKSPWLDWVVIGGESGENARGFDLDWALDMVAACKKQKIPVFMKQLGDLPHVRGLVFDGAGKKGGNFDAFPEALQVREWPWKPGENSQTSLFE